MDALFDIFIVIVMALAATVFAQFGVTLDGVEFRRPVAEQTRPVHRSPPPTPAPKRADKPADSAQR